MSFLLCFGAGAIGSMATRRAPEVYANLVRPSWAPPSGVFAPVWTTLYVLMAIAAWLVWNERGIQSTTGPLILFLVQLALNALWSWLFFAWRRGRMAEIEVLVLLVLIALTVIAFWRVRPLAGILMLPYLAWVSYATALTFAIVRRNPDLL